VAHAYVVCTSRTERGKAEREPAVWASLLQAMSRVEEHHRDACYLEFTYEAGDLWLLQLRPGRFVGAAAVRLATDLADEGAIGRNEALLRVSPRHLHHVGTTRIAADHADVLTRGLGACPGVAIGRVATTADTATRMAAAGPVILVRPETSPTDMHGIAAAAGIVTARGGPASHAAVVARAMGKPAVVGLADLTLLDGAMRVGEHTVGEGTLIAIDGTCGRVILGNPRITTSANDPHPHRLLTWADVVSGDTSDRPQAERLSAAHAALRHAWQTRTSRRGSVRRRRSRIGRRAGHRRGSADRDGQREEALGDLCGSRHARTPPSWTPYATSRRPARSVRRIAVVLPGAT